MPGVKVGELCPGSKDTVVLGIGSRSLSRTDHASSGGKISSKRGSPMGLRGLGTGQGKGQEGEARP